MAGEINYRANGFAPETGGRVHAGALTITADRIHFQSPTVQRSLPIGGLRLRRGGHNDEQIFFEHPDHPGWSIYSSDEALTHDPVLSVHPMFSGVLRAADRSRKAVPLPVILGLGLLAVLFGGLVLLWLAKDPIADYIAEKIPVNWEEKFGDQVFQSMTSEGKLLTNSPWADQVKVITDRLHSAVQDTGYNFRFHIMQDTNVNAFAIPGGHVVILTGLLEEADSAEEVAGVLAHELAHVTRRHSLRNIVKSAGLIIILQAVLGDTSGLLGLAAEGSRYLLQQKFSRDFEREADDFGWAYLVEAKIDPRGMIRFFTKLKEIVANSPAAAMEGSLSLLSTHPASAERIERLSQKWEQTTKRDFTELGPWKKSN